MLHNPRMVAWMGQSWGHLCRWPNNALATSYIPTRKRALLSEFVAVCYIWPSTICVLHSGLCMYVYKDPCTGATACCVCMYVYTDPYTATCCVMYVYINPYTAAGCVCTCEWIHAQQRVVYVRLHTHDPIYNALLPDAP